MTSTALFPVLNSDQMLAEMTAYSRHVRGDYDYTIHIEPMPTPRPRSKVMSSRKGQPCTPYVLVYNPQEYTKYKEALILLMRSSGVKAGDYKSLFIRFGVPFNIGERKKKIQEGIPHRKQFDTDNLTKAVLDGMQQGGIITDDRVIYKISAMKVGTYDPGYISFSLS